MFSVNPSLTVEDVREIVHLFASRHLWIGLSWQITQGEIIDVEEKKVVYLLPQGTLIQTVDRCFGVPWVADKLAQLDFDCQSQSPIVLQISVTDTTAQTVYCQTISPAVGACHLTDIPFEPNYTLRLTNQGQSVYLSDFYLYQQCQENGIIDQWNQPKALSRSPYSVVSGQDNGNHLY